MEKEKVDLLPCPFCGGQLSDETYSHKSVIACYSSDCKADVCTDWQPNFDEAAKVWNTRTESARIEELEKEREKIRKALEFYADESHWADASNFNYEQFRSIGGNRIFMVFGDGFDLAREVLTREGE